MNDELIKDNLKLIKSTLPDQNNCPKTVKAIYDYILKERVLIVFIFARYVKNVWLLINAIYDALKTFILLY